MVVGVVGKTAIAVNPKAVVDQIIQRTKGELFCSKAKKSRELYIRLCPSLCY